MWDLLCCQLLQSCLVLQTALSQHLQKKSNCFQKIDEKIIQLEDLWSKTFKKELRKSKVDMGFNWYMLNLIQVFLTYVFLLFNILLLLLWTSNSSKKFKNPFSPSPLLCEIILSPVTSYCHTKKSLDPKF